MIMTALTVILLSFVASLTVVMTTTQRKKEEKEVKEYKLIIM